MKNLDWQGLLQTASAVGLKPSEFWALTPVEFAFLTGRITGSSPLLRDRLAELSEVFPDTPQEVPNG